LPTKLIEGKSIPKNAKVSIGIDQSLTGFALTILSIDKPDHYITWVYKSPYFGIERLADIRAWLSDNLYYADEHWDVQDLALEGTVLASQAALVLGELSAVVRLTIFDHYDEEDPRRFPLKVSPMTLKKYAAGKGNAKKQEMLLQIYKRWGIEFSDDNAADSYALARLVGKTAIDAVEKTVVEQMSDAKYRDQPRL
jgi:Holliday junction resolvasome RuvABC endonuclease subunit